MATTQTPPAAAPTNGGAADTPKAKPQPRPYKITTTEMNLDLSSVVSEKAAIELLKAYVVDDEPLSVTIKIGRSIGLQPKEALKNLAGVYELDGDYDVTAESATTTFKQVKSEVKPSISIGGE